MTNTWQEDLEWYDTHQTTDQIGFNPDGMCLKVCRTSRAVGPKYMTAKECQDAVPKELRVYRVRDWRKGMKLFVDDPNDSNTAGHIVTIVGRVKGFDWDDPNDVIVETNSVVSGQLVRVRATYFTQNWGDKIQFAAPWINGVELDYPGWKHDGRGEDVAEKPKPDTAPRVQNFRESGNKWNVNILDRAVEIGGRRDIKPKIEAMERAVENLPDDLKDSRVDEFKKTFEEDRVLNMMLLNTYLEDHPNAIRVKAGRDKLRVAIKSVLRH
jgi:hypothetical protein